MPQLNFFATKPDLEQVFAFIYAETDLRVFESYSEYDQPLREFSSFDALEAALQAGIDPYGNGTAILLQMWSPSVTRKPAFERIALNPRKCKGHTFRYCITGSELFQLYLGGIHERIITHSHFGHFSERGAARWGDVSHIDWVTLMKISGRFKRHISRKLTVAKALSYPILSDAFEKSNEGYELRFVVSDPPLNPIPLPQRAK